jgi:hypothetical protein
MVLKVCDGVCGCVCVGEWVCGSVGVCVCVWVGEWVCGSGWVHPHRTFSQPSLTQTRTTFNHPAHNQSTTNTHLTHTTHYTTPPNDAVRVAGVGPRSDPDPQPLAAHIPLIVQPDEVFKDSAGIVSDLSLATWIICSMVHPIVV